MADRSDVRDNRGQSRFELDLGDAIAVAEYHRTKHKITFLHTDVPPGHEGQGIGGRLIRAGLDAARSEGLKVVPVCPFFAAHFRKHPEDRDLLDPAWFAKLGIPASSGG